MRIKNHDNLVRDPKTKAVLSSNAVAIEAYRRRKAKFERLNTLESRLEKLEAKIEELS